MERAPQPGTTGSSLAAFGPKISAALRLRASFYLDAAQDSEAWRPAAGMVALAAITTDSFHPTNLDIFLTLRLGTWVFIPIIVLAAARWTFATGLATISARVLGSSGDFGRLLRCNGFAHAPALLLVIPAVVYGLGMAEVTSTMLFSLRWIVLVWMLATLTTAARCAAQLSAARALPVAITAHLGTILFDLSLDGLLLTLSEGIPTPPGSTALLALH
jgi:hypothetical protein